MGKEASKEEVTYKEYLKRVTKLFNDGKIDLDARLELMSLGGSLSHASFVRGQDEGVRISKM
tara:strand:- start:394 stop:579 length:186 start_codon:yes stop_codon:yes gene_type:complete